MAAQYKRHPDASDTVDATLDLFAAPGVATSVLDGRHAPIQTSFPLTPAGDVQFDVPATTNKYLDLSSTYLTVEVSVHKADDSNFHATTAANINVWPEDNFGQSLFRSVELSVNGTTVERELNYPHRAFLETLVNFEKGAKLTSRKLEGWSEDKNLCKDGAGDADTTIARKTTIFGSKRMHFLIKLHLSFFNQDRPLFPGNTFRVKLGRNEAAFCMHGADDNPADGAVVKLHKCVLWVRQLDVNPSIQDAHNQQLLNYRSALYPIDRVSTAFHTLSPGTITEERTIQPSGQLPKYMFVGLAKHAAVAGSYGTSPFRFGHNNVRSIALYVDGVPFGEPYTPDYTAGDYGRAYFHFLTTGRASIPTGHDVSPAEYKDGRAFYGFDLSGDLDSGGHLIKSGTLSVKITFSAGLAATLALYVYMVKDDTVEINVNRQTSTSGEVAV